MSHSIADDGNERHSAAPAVRAVWDALDGVNDPEIRKPITELGMVTSVKVNEAGEADVRVLLTIAGCPAARKIEADTTAAVAGAAGVTTARVEIGVMSPTERAAFVQRVRGERGSRTSQFGPDSLTRVLAVTSGKGGVGKSSVTVGLAVALAKQGFSVGIVDVDVFGFSIPALLGLSRDGVTTQPTRVGDMILPPEAYGVSAISIGMFLGDADPRTASVSWRGPMLHRTVEQFLRDVWFGDLDILLLDLPPGTGDIAISVGQLLPQAEVIVVTTPQEAASDVAVRSGLVARQSGQRVIGVIENMAGFAQPDGTLLDIFGTGGGQLVADRLSEGADPAVPLLGSIPLSIAFREASDSGTPAVAHSPQDPAAAELIRVAQVIASQGRGLAGRSLGLGIA